MNVKVKYISKNPGKLIQSFMELLNTDEYAFYSDKEDDTVTLFFKNLYEYVGYIDEEKEEEVIFYYSILREEIVDESGNKSIKETRVPEDPTDLFNELDVIYSNHDKTGIPYAKEDMINLITSYRFEKQEYFMYDGHRQRWTVYDSYRMDKMKEYIISGKMTSIVWKYAAEEEYVVVTDPFYFENMTDSGFLYEQICRDVEKQLVEKVTGFTSLEEIESFDYKLEFDNLVEEQKNCQA